jgi:hypothetical protein
VVFLVSTKTYETLSGLFLLLLIQSPGSFAQDLTGTWEGRSGNGEYVKMVLVGQGDTYAGYTYDAGIGYCKANFMGSFKTANQQLKGGGEGFIEKTFGHSLCNFKLTFKPGSDGDYLVGTVIPKSIATKILSFGIPFPLHLKRISNRIDTTAFMYAWLQKKNNPPAIAQNTKKDSIPTNTISEQTNSNNKPAITNDSATTVTAGLPRSSISDSLQAVQNKARFYDSIRTVKNQRLPDILKTITTRADSIVITISDNEVVDGDTVTVFHNNEVLISQLFVSARPWRVVIPLSKTNRHHEFIMVANNLGRIPPNTALLTIEAGRERYQLKTSSDLTKNAVIIFEYKE